MERKTPFITSNFYHIYTRGVEKRIVFESENDYQRLQLLLYLCNAKEPVNMRDLLSKHKGEPLVNIFEKHGREETLVNIIAYALMPNHFHLLLEEKTENGISRFMLKLMTSYSMYFNTKNKRSGPLFTRPFRSRHIDSDEYLRWVFSYINLNPLELHQDGWKKEIKDINATKKFIQGYPYASFTDYFVSTRKASRLLNMNKTEKLYNLKNFDALIEQLSQGEPFARFG